MNKRTPIINVLAKFASYLIRLIFPPKCIICGDLLYKESEMCDECLEVWKKARLSKCPVCNKTARGCNCRTFHLLDTDLIGEKRISALAFYGKFGSEDKRDILVRRLVYALKTADDRSSVRFVSRELSRQILHTLIKAGENISDWKITYPPRSRKRIKKYAFDHGKQVAKMISEYTGIPFEDTMISHTKKAQKSLNSMERKQNADTAYSIKEGFSPSGKYILVDDVITTGATVNAAARLLKFSGAEAVYPVCIARSKKKKRRLRRPAEKPWFTAK